MRRDAFLGLVFGFALALMAVILAVIVSFWNTRFVYRNSIEISYSYHNLTRYAEILSLLKDAETGQRGFLLTGENSYLEPYRKSLSEIQRAMARLGEQKTGDPEHDEHLGALQRLIDDRLDLLAQGIKLRELSGPGEALQYLSTGRGKQAMDRIRELISWLEQVERGRLRERQQRSQRSYTTALVLGSVVVLVSLGIVVSAFYLVYRELSARIEAETVIRQERERLRTTLTSIGDAVIVTDEAGRVLLMNSVARNLTGWGEDAIGRELADVFRTVQEATGKTTESPVQRVLEAGTVLGSTDHKVLIHRDGREVPIEENAAPIRDESGKIDGVVLVFRDITERRKAERERDDRMRQAMLVGQVGLALTQEEDLRAGLQVCVAAIVEHLDAAFARIWTLNAETQVLELQASAGLYTHRDGQHSRVPVGQFKIGRIAQEKQPHLTNSVLSDAWVTDQEWARREGMVAFAGFPLLVEGRLVGVLAMFGRRPFSGAGLESMKTVANAIAVGIDRVRAEQALEQAKSELEARVRERTAELMILNESLRLEIHDRLHAEEQLQSFSRELQRSNRELEEFATVASHDLQEPLRKIQAFTDRLQTRYASGLAPEIREYLDRIDGAATRMRALIDALLTYSRVTRKGRPFSLVDVTQVAREVLVDLEGRLQQTNGRVEIGTLPSIEADPTQLHQLLQNLIGNALKFCRPDVPPVVRVESRIEEADAGNPGYCEIRVTDNGIGFEQVYADRIFGVFERLHGRGKYEGTGMGLAICRRIVERHGGTIRAESVPGELTTFTVRLPLRQSGSNTAA